MEKVKQNTRRLTIVVSKPLHDQLTEMVDKNEETKSDFVRLALEREIKRRKAENLEKSASDLAILYRTEEELVAFNSLDGEDFL